jgi:hypothetical protein
MGVPALTIPKRIAVVSAAVLLLAAGVWSAWWYWGIPAAHINGIPDIGPPFDVAQFGVLNISDESNAFISYSRANELLVRPTDDVIDEMSKIKIGSATNRDAIPPAVSGWLALNQPALEAWRQGTERPEALYHQPRDGSLNTDLPVVEGLRILVRLAVLQAFQERIAGRMDAAWSWHRAALRCSRHCGAHGCLIERIVGCEIFDLTWRQAASWASDDRTTASMLSDAVDDVMKINGATPPFSQNVRSDYFQLTNAIRDTARRGAGIPAALNGRYWRFEPDASIRVVNLIYSNWLSSCDLRWHERPARSAVPPMLYQLQQTGGVNQRGLSTAQIEAAFDKTILCKLLLPAADLAQIDVRRDEMRRGFLLLTLALQLHHRRVGQFPETIDQLLAAELRELPIDPFGAGGTFGYRLDAKSAIVWSGPIETERTGQSSDQAFAVRPPADSA